MNGAEFAHAAVTKLQMMKMMMQLPRWLWQLASWRRFGGGGLINAGVAASVLTGVSVSLLTIKFWVIKSRCLDILTFGIDSYAMM